MTDDTRPCPKDTCEGTMRTLGTGHIAGVTTRYWECGRCRHYQRDVETEHQEPTLNLDQ